MENNDQQLLTSPDWSIAPDWAQWFAVDWNGQGYYYEQKPERATGKTWELTKITTLFRPAGMFKCANWKNSLQKRP